MNNYNRIEIKRQSRVQLSKNRGFCILITLCTLILSSISVLDNYVGMIATILTILLSYFMIKGYLMVADKPDDGGKFIGIFNNGDIKNFFKYVLASVLFSFIILIGFIFFIFPGIYLMYKYYFVLYIIVDDPNISIIDAFKRSGAITKGYKIDLFILELSFIGWIFLGILTMGLGMLYVLPYINLAYVNAYKTLSKNKTN